jgi:hypothetical protein
MLTLFEETGKNYLFFIKFRFIFYEEEPYFIKL